jgi:hypothetical protein
MSGRPISILIFANSILGIKTLYDWQAKNVDGKGFGSVADRVRTEVGNAPLNDGLVLFWSSCLTVVGCEFRNIRPGDDDRKTAIKGRTSPGFPDWDQTNHFSCRPAQA